jgi:hypothetical protein
MICAGIPAASLLESMLNIHIAISAKLPDSTRMESQSVGSHTFPSSLDYVAGLNARRWSNE